MKRPGVPRRRIPPRGGSGRLSPSSWPARAKGRPATPSSLGGGGQLSRRRKKRPPEGPLSIEDWANEIWLLDEGYSRASGVQVLPYLAFPGGRADLRYFHHPLPKWILRDRGLYDRVWDPRNGILVTPDEHVRHETAAARIPYDRLPERTIEFATELGDWAVSRLLRYHPPAKEEP